MIRPVNYVRDIEILGIVAGDEVWVDIYDEFLPRF